MTEVPTRYLAPPGGFAGLPGLTRARRLLDLPAAIQRRGLEPVRTAFYRTLWQQAAAAVGARATPDAAGAIRIQQGNLVTYVRRSEVMLDSALTQSVIGDKALCYEMFARKGYPVPQHAEFSLGRLAEAEGFLKRIGGSVVVKPLAGTGGGRGVTTGIATAAALRRAARYASGYGTRLLVEQELSGQCVRLLYLDGVFLDAVRRDRPEVTGDGRRTIRALIRAENRLRRNIQSPRALSPLRIDGDLRNTLARAGRRLGDCPAPGERVTVKGAVNENAASGNTVIRDRIHPDIVDRIQRLVADIGVRCAGVDLLVDDIASPFDRSGALIHEINVNPGLHHHVLVANPSQVVAVAERVLTHMFDNRTGVIAL